MKKFTLSAVASILLVAGIAYGQAALPMQAYGQVALSMQAVQANRVVVRIDAGQWKDVSFRADSAVFENGGMRLTGNVRITVSGHVMTANTAVLRSGLLTLEGDAKVEPPAAR
jgi:formylmethanofuran dehydrogenase subunit C